MNLAECEVVSDVGLRIEEVVRRVTREQELYAERGEIIMPYSFMALVKSELVGMYESLAGLPLEAEGEE